MKRAGDEPAEGSSEPKKAMAGGGGVGNKGMPSGESKTNPIPRPIRENEITLHFNQVTWEEIGPSELKYLPLCQSPYYMLDNATLNLLKKYKGLWSTAQYHTPKARISNIIMLQDDLVNQGGTPLETTAFTQACYMIEFCPVGQTQFFHLANMYRCRQGVLRSLTYDLSSVECDTADVSQLIKVQGYDDFEKLVVQTAKVNIYGGYNPNDHLRRNMTDNVTTLDNIYIPPNDKDIGFLAYYSGNMQPGNLIQNLVKPYDQITFARNMGKFKLHSYNDTFEIPIHTNIEGKSLLNAPTNDFTNRSISFEKDGIKYTYYTEFCWPSSNRPYFDRSTNFSDLSPYLANKDLSSLKHYFFTMPPIRKANGALLKQRASFMLEQSFSVTFKFPESVWEEDDVHGESTTKYMLDQTNAIILRPNLYGNLIKEFPDTGMICPAGTRFSCDQDLGRCPPGNDANALMTLWVNVVTESLLWTITFSPEGDEPDDGDIVFTDSNDNYFTNSTILSAAFATEWKKFILKKKEQPNWSGKMYFKTTASQRWRGLGFNLDNGNKFSMINPFIAAGIPGGTYFYILIDDYVKWVDWAGVTCTATGKDDIKPRSDTDLKPMDRNATVFFC